MTPIYVRTNVLFRDSVTVQSSAGTFNNALVDGDWTKALSESATGGQSTTGITVTKTSVDTVGKYDVEIPAARLATDGWYTLTLYVTADPTISFTQLYIANESGTPEDSGILSFTATANDGRIEDTDGNPLLGATVFLSYGTYVVSFSTDSNGLWGPWKTNASVGVVNISVVKTGYAVATSSLTVGALAITGPGADIALSAQSSTGQMTAGEAWAYARRMAHNKPGALADARIIDLVNDAADKLAMDVGSNGNYYVRRSYLAVKEPYSTGTLALTQDSTTCVLTGGTFPSWAASGSLYINGQPLLEIASRNSATSLTLASAWGGETTAAVSYVLSLDNYALESNAVEFMGIMNGQSWPYMAGAVTIERLWELQNSITNLSQRGAWNYAIANNRMHLYPYPSEDAQVAYIYRARPTPLSVTGDMVDIDPTWVSAFHKQINCQVAIAFGGCVAGTLQECEAAYEKALASLVGNIKTPRGIGNRGRNMGAYDYWRAICRTP